MSRLRIKIPDALRPMADRAREAGWVISRRNSGHLEWRSPDGTVVITPSTPSCARGSLNSRAQLRRAGLKEES